MHIWTHRWRWLHNKLWLMHGSHVIKYQIFSFVYICRCCSYSCDWCRCTLSCRITLNDKIQGAAFDCSTRRWWGETCAIRHGSNLHSTWTLKEFVKRYVNKYNVRNKMYQHLIWQEQQYYGHADKEGKPDGFITCNKDSVNLLLTQHMAMPIALIQGLPMFFLQSICNLHCKGNISNKKLKFFVVKE